MQATIKVTLPDETRLALDNLSRSEGTSPSQLILEALQEYLYFRKLRLLRDRLITKAQARGVTSEQDILDNIS
jgi:metal-responsive CopG/Arc/MetJ family transcriptional regulator